MINKARSAELLKDCRSFSQIFKHPSVFQYLEHANVLASFFYEFAGIVTIKNRCRLKFFFIDYDSVLHPELNRVDDEVFF